MGDAVGGRARSRGVPLCSVTSWSVMARSSSLPHRQVVQAEALVARCRGGRERGDRPALFDDAGHGAPVAAPLR